MTICCAFFVFSISAIDDSVEINWRKDETKGKENKMTNVENAIEFNLMKDKLKEFAFTQNAKHKITNLCPYLAEAEVLALQRETSEAKKMIEKAGNPPLTEVSEVQCLVSMAQIGGCLTTEQLEQIATALAAVKRLKDYLIQGKHYELSLAYYEENLCVLEALSEEIYCKIRGQRVDDFATNQLKNLRNSILQTEQKMREKADAALKSNKLYLSDQFSTIKNGHICIPIKKEYRYKLNGAVIEKSATGNTLFIEPTAVTKCYDEWQYLRLDEENEVIRILYELSSMVAEAGDEIEMNNRTIEKLDFIFARGKLSIWYDGIAPEINTERKIQLFKARHPLMDQAINVPLDFKIGNGISGVVITGPNTGGKTVAIKTVALNCMMAQCGLHVAAKQAEICLNSAFLCDIGDGQNLAENLSTFSAHIKNVMDILRRADKECLVILDELGSGTDPTEGMGIAIAILQELKACGALYLVTTHYPEVKNYAKRSDGLVNARMTFDKETLQPLYELVIGEAGESCAFHIASKLGMPSHILQNASLAAYGKELVLDSKVPESQKWVKEKGAKIQKRKQQQKQQVAANKFNRGDSVMVFPDKKIGIVCQTADEQGRLCVQLQHKKIYISHKRIKLQVAADQLYPEDYDYSIIFESVANRKLRHDMDRKYVEEVLFVNE
jgi:dsDNA-specific endonuclease/ATPase MutS2